MSAITIEAELREKCGKGLSHQLRREGKIPAVFYGMGVETLHLSINPKHLDKAVSGELGMNALLQLKVKDKGDFHVILKEYQAGAIHRQFTHVDFVNIDMTKKITVKIPVKLIGKSIGVKEGGILEQTIRELEVECLPTNIIKEITVDITDLQIGHNIHLDDMKFSSGVEPTTKSNLTIVSVVAPREEIVEAVVESEAAAGGAPSEPEVLTAKKDDKETDAKAGGSDKKK